MKLTLSEVRALMAHEPIGNDLHETLDGEDDREDDLHLLLQHPKG